MVIAKILRIAKRQRSTSIADFIAARYGKSQLLGGLVAAIAVFGVTPYIALQLKAVSISFDLLAGTDPTGLGTGPHAAILGDKAFYVALLMAAFAIVFGTRNIDAAEHHQGMVAAVAFESVVKLLSFLAVGIMVVWGIHDGFADLFDRTAASPDIARLLTAEPALGDGSWITVTLLSMAAIICLPRQFQLMIVENVREAHLRRALWLFPLYMLLINLFVLPVAVAGLMLSRPARSTPICSSWRCRCRRGGKALALFAFVGGLSAATSMIIVETVALSTMVSNDLVIPALLRLNLLKLDRHPDLTRLLLAIRRTAILTILLMGYGYFRFAGSAYALGAIGLISFAAVAQFAPALIGGIFWSGGTRRGAITGLVGGDSGLDLYAPAAVLRPLGLAGPRLPVRWSRWHGAAAALCAVRSGRAGPAVARAVLEHGAECRALCRGVAVRPAQRRRAGPGQCLRRRVPDDGAGDRGLLVLARQHDGRRA